MPSVVVHDNDAEAFIKKFGQPRSASPGPSHVHLVYSELPDEAVKIAADLQTLRAAGQGVGEKLLKFSDEGELTHPKVTDEIEKAAAGEGAAPAGDVIIEGAAIVRPEVKEGEVSAEAKEAEAAHIKEQSRTRASTTTKKATAKSKSKKAAKR